MANQEALFSKADKNYDGRITPDESAKMKREASKPRLKKKFEKLDKDYNGYLTYDEVYTAHETLIKSRLQRAEQTRERLLKRYDHDGNGTITSGEIDAQIEKDQEQISGRVEGNTQRDFERKDVDENGTVTLDEYIDSHQTSPGMLFGVPKGTVILKRDGNGDNVIGRLENQQFAEKLFAELDKDKDGDLSAKEQGHRTFKQAKSIQANSRFIMSDNSSPFDIFIRK